jgi:dTMP kinase
VTTTRRRRGRFITFEGGEGAGKSTQIARLVAALRGAGIEVLATREPGGVESAERIRALLVTGSPGAWLPMSEVLLHYAARNEHVARVIRPALARGIWVVCDRFADSTMAYQGYGQGVARRAIEEIHRRALGRFRPDLTLIFDIATQAGLGRTRERKGDETRYENMARRFHERVRRGFLAIARREQRRCARIDAGREIDDVSRQVFAAVAKRLRVTIPA